MKPLRTITMAAILCESISKILKGTCEACGAVICLPCKACGFTADMLVGLCRSPFCLYLTVAIGLNLPPIIFAGLGSGIGGCSSASTWLNVNAILCFINMAAAAYISMKITHEQKDDGGNTAPFVGATMESDGATKKSIVQKVMDNTLETHTRSRSLGRVKDILCYDPIVAVYIIIGIFFVVWQTLGIERGQSAQECGDEMKGYIFSSFACGFAFIWLGAMTFACSLCCLR